MNNPVKLRLSAEEMELVNNREWILTKHRVIKKVYEMFGEINEMMKNEVIYSDHLFYLLKQLLLMLLINSYGNDTYFIE